MTTQEFWDLCYKHDWYFEQGASSLARYERGMKQRAILRDAAQESEQHARIYAEYAVAKFNGPTWGTAPKPYPIRPLSISTFPGPQPAKCEGQLSLF